MSVAEDMEARVIAYRERARLKSIIGEPSKEELLHWLRTLTAQERLERVGPTDVLEAMPEALASITESWVRCTICGRWRCVRPEYATLVATCASIPGLEGGCHAEQQQYGWQFEYPPELLSLLRGVPPEDGCSLPTTDDVSAVDGRFASSLASDALMQSSLPPPSAPVVSQAYHQTGQRR